MKFPRLAALSSCGLLLTAPALWAQDVVGTSLIDGVRVELLDDNTWRYAEAQAHPGCDAITGAVRFCPPAGAWQSSPAPSADITAAYRHDDRHYAQFIVEALGRRDGATAEMMRRIVVQNASAATGLPPADIPTLGIEPAVIGKNSGETIVYQVNFDGIDVIFANTVVIEEAQMMQAMTYAIGTDFSAKHRALHKDFLSAITMD